MRNQWLALVLSAALVSSGCSAIDRAGELAWLGLCATILVVGVGTVVHTWITEPNRGVPKALAFTQAQAGPERWACNDEEKKNVVDFYAPPCEDGRTVGDVGARGSP